MRVVEVVEALLARPGPGSVARGRGALRLGDVPAGEVAAADVEHLALLHQLLHRLPDLLPRRVAVDVVHLVQVDVVGLQAPQAASHARADVVGRQPALVRALAHAAVDLGGQHDLARAARRPGRTSGR